MMWLWLGTTVVAVYAACVAVAAHHRITAIKNATIQEFNRLANAVKDLKDDRDASMALDEDRDDDLNG
jgi:hypothetical protein